MGVVNQKNETESHWPTVLLLGLPCGKDAFLPTSDRHEFEPLLATLGILARVQFIR